MPDSDQRCASQIYREGRLCKNPSVHGTDYCQLHQREPAPTEEDRLAVLQILAPPEFSSLHMFDVCHRIQGPAPENGRTREFRDWQRRTLTLIHAQLQLYERGLIYEAVHADGENPSEVAITDQGREFLTLKGAERVAI
jgi:hypothetical protein